MTFPTKPKAETLPGSGLCGACKHRRIITSARGSKFLLCTYNEVDPRFSKYPALPMWRCSAFASDKD